MKLIVGLGNPGQTYAGTRHNVGFMCLNYFARTHKLSFSQRASHSQIAKGEVDGIPVVLAKPLTYVNRSGSAVASLLHRWQLSTEDLVVIHDDMDLPLGQLRIRAKGSSGGHKGMGSIIAALGNSDFVRIRVGVGRPQDEAIYHVLGPFHPEEKEILNEVIALAAQAILCLIKEGIDKTMNLYNREIGKDSKRML